MKCVQIPKMRYMDFSERLHSQAIPQGNILNVSFELTYRCNLKCPYCYITQDPAKKELTTQEVKNIIDETVAAGCLWLLLTGGEPLLRKDFLEIYTYAKKKGLIISLFTNGTLITPALADYLKEFPPFSIEITLNGIKRKTYERISGVPDSFDACLKGIHLLLERKLPLKLKAMALTLNKAELGEIKNFARDSGLEFGFDPLIIPAYNGSKKPCSFRLSPQEIVELDQQNQERTREWCQLTQKFVGGTPSNTLFECGAGLGSVDIDPYGILRLCSFAQPYQYNLREGSFQEAWRSRLPQLRAQKRKHPIPTQCLSCDVGVFCSQCPAWAMLETGDPETPVEFLCQVARLRANAFAKPHQKKQFSPTKKKCRAIKHNSRQR